MAIKNTHTVSIKVALLRVPGSGYNLLVSGLRYNKPLRRKPSQSAVACKRFQSPNAVLFIQGVA